MDHKNQSTAAPSPLIDVKGLSEALAAFAAERDWDQYHSPKNLAMALTGEVGELSEIFQWLTEEASKSVATNPDTATAVREELADVTLYLVRLASVLGVDLNEAVTQKLQKNATKYPVDKAHGSHKKYDKL
jgi:dCTP diphosphatase